MERSVVRLAVCVTSKHTTARSVLVVSKTKRPPDGVHAIVDRALDRRGRTCPQVRSDFYRLSRQHLNAAYFGRIARMTDAHDIDALAQLPRRLTCRVWRQRRHKRVLRREDFDSRVADASARVSGLHDRHEVACVCRTRKLHERERRTSD